MSLNDPQTKKLLHSRDAAEILGVSEGWLARHRWAGTGPVYVKVGGINGRAVRYRETDLRDWMDRNTVAPKTGGAHV